MDAILRFRGLLAQFTEVLANLTIKNVLLAVGVMLVLLTVLRLGSRRRDSTAAWLGENLQVVLSVVVVVFLLIRPFLFQAFYIPSSSMEPTLMGPPDNVFSASRETTGDRLLVNKLIYKIDNPHRLDIVVFKAPPAASPEEKEFIKRTIGLPGETVEVVPPRMLADGRALFRLAADGGLAGLILSDRTEPKVDPGGTTARLKVGYADERLKVIADPNPQVRYSPNQVTMNGKVELEDSLGSIVAQEGAANYGGDTSIPVTIYSIRDEPRLAVVTASKLQYDPGHVEVSGRRLIEPYIEETPRYAMAPRKLGPHEYFMMGDNRNNSNDSHVWGALSRERVIGRAEILFWPLNRFRIFHWWLVAALAGMFIGYQVLLRLLGGR